MACENSTTDVLPQADDVFIGRLIHLVRKERMVKMSLLSSQYYKMHQQLDPHLSLPLSDLTALCRDLSLIHPLRVDLIDHRGRELYLMFEERFYYAKWLNEMISAQRFALLEAAIGRRLPEDSITLKNIGQLRDALPMHPLEQLQEDQQIRVILVNVVSPSHIYVNWIKYREAFKFLRNVMRAYNKQDRDLDQDGEETDIVIPFEFLIPLLPVAARNPLDHYQWNRCLVYEYPTLPMTEDTITVFSIDMGNEFQVDRRELRYLKTEYLTQLPAQAFRVSLHGVDPVRGNWSQAASGVFEQYVSKHYWVNCHVVSVNDFSCKVRLCDFTSRKKVYLDHLLVRMGYAKFNDQHIPVDESSDDDEKDDDDRIAVSSAGLRFRVKCHCLKLA